MPEIDAATARQWIDNGQAALVDVREAGEYAARHVPGALHVPLGQLASAPLPAGKLVLMCASGMRSGRGCATLIPKGHEVFSLKGGISAWANAGGATAAAPGAAEAAAKQAKVMAGGAVALGLALSALVHPGFIILTALAGARLVSLMRPVPQGGGGGCSSKSAGQSSCASPDKKTTGSGCSGCGAR